MAENSNIAWTDSTWNPWRGCTQVSPGCDHCYAKALNDRFGWNAWGPDNKPIRTKTWGDPRRWQRNAPAFYAEHGRKQRVFCASLADIFDNNVPSEWRADFWQVVRECPDLIIIVLTKRIGNAKDMLPDDWGLDGYPNVWLLATMVNQEEVDRDMCKLLSLPAVVHGISYEPALGPIRVDAVRAGHMDEINAFGGLDWTICGAESGPGHRPMEADWARSLRDQCAETGTAFFFKQWGGPKPGGEALLDGREHKEFPDDTH